MRMAKASNRDVEIAMIVMGMIDDIERGQYPRRANGELHPDDPENWSVYWDPDCRVFVERLLEVVSAREAGGALLRVIGGMDTVLKNDVFDPALDYLSWHPDLLPAIEVRQRRADEKEQAFAEKEPS